MSNLSSVLNPLWEILQIIGSLGVFIYGMKVMSEGLQKMAGNRMREVLKGMTSNKLSGILTGAISTTIVQSSSAITVMVVSFVNAGLLTLVESIGVVMGSNIGTTVTAWIITLFGFKVKITPIAIALIGVAFPFLFSKKQLAKYIAEFILGFGILFIGLQFLKESVPDLKNNPEVLTFINLFTDKGFWSILLFIGFGALLTVIVQSSSASTTITLIMLSKGWIPFDLAAAMILGENIGTTITANIAASIGNVHAKRTARFHLLFNLIGVLWMLPMFHLFIGLVQGSIDNVLAFLSNTFNNQGLFENKELLSLALFHSAFNVSNVLALMWFTKPLSQLVERIVVSKNDEDEESSLKYISMGVMTTASLSLANARKELEVYARLINKMINNSYTLFFDEHVKRPDKLVQKINDHEQITDEKELAIIQYLVKVGEADLSTDSSSQIQSMLNLADNLESVGDMIKQIAGDYVLIQENKFQLPEVVKVDLKKMFDVVIQMIKVTRENLDSNLIGKVDIDTIERLEQELDDLREAALEVHQKRLEKSVYSARAGVIFMDVVTRTERIGDYLLNANQALEN